MKIGIGELLGLKEKFDRIRMYPWGTGDTPACHLKLQGQVAHAMYRNESEIMRCIYKLDSKKLKKLDGIIKMEAGIPVLQEVKNDKGIVTGKEYIILDQDKYDKVFEDYSKNENTVEIELYPISFVEERMKDAQGDYNALAEVLDLVTYINAKIDG